MAADSRDDIEAKSKELEDKSGIQRGVDGIISVLHGDSAEWQPKAALRVDDIRTGDLGALFMFLFIVTLLVVAVWQNVRSGHYVSPPRPTGFSAGRPLVEFFQLEQQRLFKRQFVR